MNVNRLEATRAKAGISQQKFADILGLSLSTYKRLINSETTKYHDGINIASRIYKETGMFLFQLFEDDFEQDDMLRVVNKISKLSKEHLATLEQYADLCNHESIDFKDADRNMAMHILEEMYHKIIKLDLNEDSYVPYRVDTQEWNAIKNKTGRISVWIKAFVADGYVHPDDVEDFLAFMNISNLKKMLRRESGFVRHKYRRKNGKVWEWCMMEIKRSADYVPDHPVAIAYIRMVDADYA